MSHAKLLADKRQTHWSLWTDLSMVWFQVRSGCGLFGMNMKMCSNKYIYIWIVSAEKWHLALFLLSPLQSFSRELAYFCVNIHPLPGQMTEREKGSVTKCSFQKDCSLFILFEVRSKNHFKIPKKKTWNKLKLVFQPLSIFLSRKRHTILKHMANFQIVCKADLL